MRPLFFGVCAAAALAPLAALAAPAAPTTGTTADARCLIAMAAFTSAKDPNTARTAQAGVIFFAGRIKADDPSFDLGSRLKPLAASMTPETLQTEAQQRCGPMLLAAMRELDAAQQAFGPPPSSGAPASSAPPPRTTTPPPKR
jgi:hypothetical protein